jgi:SAM-dependent methyltransferase
MRKHVDSTLIKRMVRNEADMAYRRRVQTIFEWLQPEDQDIILDGGCGRGFYLNFLRAAGNAALVGIELEHEFLQIARASLSHLSGIQLVSANLYCLPFENDHFDKAILSEVLEHVDDDVAALASVGRVLKPGGLVAITVPNANYPFWWDPINKTLEVVFGIHIAKGVFAGIWANHVRLYTRRQLRNTVLAAGLEIADERSFTHHCFPFIHNLVYGLGKTLLEAHALPGSVASAADRYRIDGQRGSPLNPVNFGLTLFELFDRPNTMNEPDHRSTVNLCILARKPVSGSKI